ncbi:5-(carboxyamino)imidazole ribonucleotide synthase [Pokkaliibacter sp. CJK22405]|uniref:5-(carboxyamino)imidazole ribonucleotide synthase n=1 Tax=Pokkaliibacter sp. CJK22405 TaxID=3384615 RepID=UPI003984B10E
MKVGILGGGQLARMLAIAGYPHGLTFTAFDPAKGVCAGDVCPVVEADYGDDAALKHFGEQVDVVTFEFENVAIESAQALEQTVPLYPSTKALAATQDRLVEKSLFRDLGIKTPGFQAIDTRDDVQAAIDALGLPLVIKTRRFGYDGKGQFVLRTTEQIDELWNELGGQALIAEAFVPFDREVSIIAVRSQQGDVRFYPLTQNEHRSGILHLSRPLVNGDSRTAQAQEFISTLLNKLDYVGTIALELFQVGDELLANEFAPRVHNSGHWTIEGAETSQFENHVRAVAGIPLGDTRAIEHSAMINIIGDFPDRQAIQAIDGAHFHDYGKAPRAGRKIGHVTVTAPDAVTLDQRIAAVTGVMFPA